MVGQIVSSSTPVANAVLFQGWYVVCSEARFARNTQAPNNLRARQWTFGRDQVVNFLLGVRQRCIGICFPCRCSCNPCKLFGDISSNATSRMKAASPS